MNQLYNEREVLVDEYIRGLFLPEQSIINRLNICYLQISNLNHKIYRYQKYLEIYKFVIAINDVILLKEFNNVLPLELIVLLRKYDTGIQISNRYILATDHNNHILNYYKVKVLLDKIDKMNNYVCIRFSFLFPSVLIMIKDIARLLPSNLNDKTIIDKINEWWL